MKGKSVEGDVEWEHFEAVQKGIEKEGRGGGW